MKSEDFLPLDETEEYLDDVKQVVSIRLNNADRTAVRHTAARLFVRESKLYRFAIDHLLSKLHKLQDENCTGCDLLPIFLEFKEELHSHLGLKKHQLFKIMNGKNTAANKFVSMADIELLLMPEHGVRQRLQLTKDAADTKTADTAVWLADYLIRKYALPTKAKQSADNEV
jgi:hypothetical protein